MSLDRGVIGSAGEGSVDNLGRDAVGYGHLLVAAGDIDLDRAKGEGPRVLKRFLEYAESGVLEEPRSVSEDADSPFEEAVAAFIEGLRYKVDKQVGSAGFKIDLAVRHPDQPGRYVLAVECDGATYHSARWARERDRLRQEILEEMGWRFHRIWSTDWFYRRDETKLKLKAALADASRPDATASPPKPNSDVVPDNTTTDNTSSVTKPVSDLRMPPYKLAEGILVPSGMEPHEVTVAVMARIAWTIVTIEGPLHQDEIARRVTAQFGKSRTGSRIFEATFRALQALKASSTLVERDNFWMTPTQELDPPVRDRSAASLSLQRADMLPPVEIRAALKIAMRENGALSSDEAAIAVARMLGFARTGPDLRAAILSAIEQSDLEGE